MARKPKRPRPPHVVVRRGEPGWGAALASCSRIERWIAGKYGVMQFRPQDPRCEIVRRFSGEPVPAGGVVEQKAPNSRRGGRIKDGG